MFVKISKDDVQQVAKLARLQLDDAEQDLLVRDLSAILQHVQQLGELDLGEVAPTTHLHTSGCPLRPDEPAPGLDAELGLAGAPERIGDGFGVPKIIE